MPHMKHLLRTTWALVFAAVAVAAVDPIPADLARIESAAEAGFDAALAADAAQAATASAAIAKSWAAYRARAVRDRVPDDAVVSVDAALAEVERATAANAPAPALARTFNSISAPLARFYAVYRPPVPPALLDLDHLGRELIIDARVADMPRARADLVRLCGRWAAFRARVMAVGGGKKSAATMDAALARARAAIEANDATALAHAALAETEVVDVIEKLFAGRARHGAD